jgi:hypothetical protein
MRSIRLGGTFDCVLLHDAVNYMKSRGDLTDAIATAFIHTAPGGAALFQPDFVTELSHPERKREAAKRTAVPSAISSGGGFPKTGKRSISPTWPMF